MAIEINGDNGNNTLKGSAANEIISGKGGHDRIYTGYGNDTALGGDGNDRIFNDGGNDLLNGGKGRDKIDFYYVGQTPNQLTTGPIGVNFDLAVTKQNILGFGNDTYKGFEDIGGTIHADILWGNKRGNEIGGSFGDDVLYGRGGNDTIEGGSNRDTIIGGTGKDLLAGYYVGNKFGDGYSDHFRYTSLKDSGITKDTRDTIWGDFFAGINGYDKIDLSRIDASSQIVFDQAFTFIGTKAFSANTGILGEVRYKHMGGDRYLIQVNADADKTPEMTILVHSQHGIHAGDFIL